MTYLLACCLETHICKQKPTIRCKFQLTASLPQTVFPSNITRDALSLYPVWTMIFYYGQPISDAQGVQVGVYGDTGQVLFCTPYILLGNYGAMIGNYTLSSTSSETMANPTANATPISSSNSLSGLVSSDYALLVICVGAASLAIGSYLFVRRKR